MTESFRQTSDLPYDRHHYKLIYTNGESVIFKNYEDLHESWWNTPSNFISHIEVLDKNSTKGFK